MTEVGLEALMSLPVACELSTKLPMADHSVALARSQTRSRLTAWHWPGDVDDAALIVSELVTNAVTHAQGADRLLTLRLAVLESGELVIDVSDPVPEFPGYGEPVALGAIGESGRGLHLVLALCRHMEWFPCDDGKTVRVFVTTG